MVSFFYLICSIISIRDEIGSLADDGMGWGGPGGGQLNLLH